MTYTLERLAPGSYDVVLNGEVVAALTRSFEGKEKVRHWLAELLTDEPATGRPMPFREAAHEFESFNDACDWLGVPRPNGHKALGPLRIE